jgi:hypothetical protein
VKYYYADGLAGIDFSSLLTDTLPYEVPIIFSNEKIFTFLSRTPSPPVYTKEEEKMLLLERKYTKPYNYSIRKTEGKSTKVSIIHPLDQILVCGFYKYYSSVILHHTSSSEFSLRAPREVVHQHTIRADANEAAQPFKMGAASEDSQSEANDDAYIKSFFAVGRYNLLSKFFRSAEFIRFEKRYRYLRQLDVSKCFFNIYTHSVSWAVKNKEFAKDNTTNVSFENSFDKLMQIVNYNETNGIIVGPEFSRVFAEVILQDADERIRRDLMKRGLNNNSDYVIRRYIDDYFIFSSNLDNVNLIEGVIADCLEEIKLYLNGAKRTDIERPFVTDLTIARDRIDIFLDDLHNSVSFIDSDTVLKSLSDHRFRSNTTIHKLRQIIATSGVSFSSFSAELLSRIGGFLSRLTKPFAEVLTPDQCRLIRPVVSSFVEVIFYICALDLRVRTTYVLYQLLSSLLYFARDFLNDDEGTQLSAQIYDGLVDLLNTGTVVDPYDLGGDRVEIYNILLIGALEFNARFVMNPKVAQILKQFAEKDITYFSFITQKFLYLRDRSLFAVELKRLNEAAARKIIGDGSSGLRTAEGYMLFCDYLASPDIDSGARLELFLALMKGNSSKAAIDSLANKFGFADWTGARVKHILRRKRLSAVYTSF